MKPNNWSYSDYIGEPIAYCNFCSKPYKTGRKKWEQMSDKEKRKLERFTYLHALVVAFWFTFIVIFILILVFEELLEWDDEFFMDYIGYITFGLFIIMYYFSVRLEKQTLAEKILEN